MIILGVDPGSRYCGYALLDVEKRKIQAAGCNVFVLKNEKTLSGKLNLLYDSLQKVLEEYKPAVAAVESIYYGKNVQTAITLGHVRGVILLALAKYNVSLSEFSPREVKKAVVGNGNASKKQVTYMVKQIVPLTNMPASEDAADALAVALTYYNRLKLQIV